MGLFDRFKAPSEKELIETTQPARKNRKVHSLSRVRRFEAAQTHRTLFNWAINIINDFDEELRADLAALQARSRDASLNDVYARRYFKALVNNVVGDKGIQLKMAVRNPSGTPDATTNDYIEQAWKDFCKEATVTGLSFHEVEKLVLETVARDGEIFVVVHKGQEFGDHNIQVQLLQSEYVDENHSNVDLGNGNFIIHGIEYNQWGKAIAYHFYRRHPTQFHRPVRSQDRMRIEADQVLHIYDRERTEHGRGFPWLSPALVQLTHLKEYQKSELIAARVASAKMGFYTRPKGENELGEGIDADDEDALITEVEPGVFDVLPEGYGLETFDPQNPNASFGEFQKAILRGVAASVGMSYHTLSNDLESTSYSSLRQGAIDERDTYRSVQQWLIHNLHRPLFERWLEQALTFKTGGLRLPFEQYSKYNAPTWRPRTWAWVDPQKETQAIKLQLEKGLRSRSDVMRGLGTDFREVMAEIAAENEYASQLGIDLNSTDSNEVSVIDSGEQEEVSPANEEA